MAYRTDSPNFNVALWPPTELPAVVWSELIDTMRGRPVEHKPRGPGRPRADWRVQYRQMALDELGAADEQARGRPELPRKYHKDIAQKIVEVMRKDEEVRSPPTLKTVENWLACDFHPTKRV